MSTILSEVGKLYDFCMLPKKAHTPLNDIKNVCRYVNVGPYDFNAVKVDGKFTSGSLIKIGSHEAIACDAPMQSQFLTFYQMLWEKGIKVICMLTEEVENGSIKADRYWPLSIDQPEKYYDDNGNMMTIQLLSQTTDGALIERKLSIQYGEITRMLTHYQYIGWRDNTNPEKGYFDKLFNIGQQALSKGLLIHCSAGIGRTGMLCLRLLLDNITDIDFGEYKEIKKLFNDAIEENDSQKLTFALIWWLRTMRGGMVNKDTQYDYCIKFVGQHMPAIKQMLTEKQMIFEIIKNAIRKSSKYHKTFCTLGKDCKLDDKCNGKHKFGNKLNHLELTDKICLKFAQTNKNKFTGKQWDKIKPYCGEKSLLRSSNGLH